MAEEPLPRRVETEIGRTPRDARHVRSGGPDVRPELQEALLVLWQRKWSILAITVLATGIALFLSGRQTPIYASDAEVLVRPLELGGDTSDTLAPNMETEQELAGSAAVAEVVADSLDSSQEPGQLLNGLSVSSPSDTEIMVFSYSHRNPEEAQRLAQAFAEAYLEYRRQTVAEALVSSAEDIQRQIQVLEDRLKEVEQQLGRLEQGDPRLAALDREASLLQAGILQRQLAQLESPERAAVGSIVQPSGLPSSPSSPDHTVNGAFGFAAGLALGIGLAFLRDRLVGRLRTDTEVEDHLGAPVLASVPRVPEWRRRKEAFLVTKSEWRSPSAEAYRILRTNLMSVASTYAAKSILVTSAHTGEGKSATAANVAVVLARAGKQVILVSGDLRRPRLNHFFNITAGPGLVDVLSGKAPLEKVLVTLTGPSAANWGENLKILPSGRATEAAAELLASEETAKVLGKLEASADFVIIDSPPLLPVTDALVLAPLVGGVLLVIGPRSVTADSVASARQKLDNVGARLLGAVLNGPDPSLLRSYYSY
jgi:capsular exopolysaccharide synthesis family protein